MTAYAELEIGLHEHQGTTWRVEIRHNQPGNDADNIPPQRLTVEIDPEAFRLIEDDEEYGRTLHDALFYGDVGTEYQKAIASAHGKDIRLRVRLFVGPSAAVLHGLRWETMRNNDGAPLLTNLNIVFSRYLSSNDYRPVRLLPKSELRALVVVSGPTNLDDLDAGRDLAPVDVEQEASRARDLLSALDTRVVAHGEITKQRLFEELRKGCDILYLVCHGFLAPSGEPILVLEDEDGSSAPLKGSALLERVRELSRVPRLVVLASCQSAGLGDETRTDDHGVLAALGPRLAEAGVPAVVAMQGNISMETVSQFMPVFFRALQDDGQIDRAMAVARGEVRGRPDWWAPALYMRLRSGRIWSNSGLGVMGQTFEKFPALVNDIRKGKCTPILGPGLSDQLLGSRQEIAQRWAKNYRFPMAPHYRDDLPQVAQYLSGNLSRDFPRDELGNYLRRALFEEYREQLPAEYYRERDVLDLPLNKLMSDVWRIRFAGNSQDPYAALANLPFSRYITTQPWNLLAEALRAKGKDPQVEPCPWKELSAEDFQTDSADWAFEIEDDPDRRQDTEATGWPISVFEREPHYEPSRQRPLVYHLFGHGARPESVVITEDDYFDFLIGVEHDSLRVSSKVLRAFTDSSLMFLGFRLDEWDFRVLFRFIVNLEGVRHQKTGGRTHVAVQIDPEEGSTIEPDRARTYLETYFFRSDITIYWGSTESFIKELHDAWVEGNK